MTQNLHDQLEKLRGVASAAGKLLRHLDTMKSLAFDPDEWSDIELAIAHSGLREALASAAEEKQ